MKPWRAITRMLPILAILGLMLAPFTAPAAADGMAAAPMTDADIPMDTASAGRDVAMAGEPCCAPVLPSVPDCPKTCPLAAMCHAKIVEGVSTPSAVLRWSSPAQASLPGDDITPDTLAQAPPARPPQA
jgi:hypothetical protein